MEKIYDYDKQSGSACAENIIDCGNVRITLLTDRLLRYEQSANGEFTDETTQGVWKRNFPPVEHTIEKTSKSVVVTTKAVTFVLDMYNFAHSYVLLNGERVSVENNGNLGGTLRTLDVVDRTSKLVVNGLDADKADRQHIRLNDGVISKNGVAVYDDSQSLLLVDEKVTERKETVDKYIFAYGQDYRAAVNDFYAISGKPPLVPRFALGNWWSRYYRYTQQEYLNLMDEFSERNIPLSVATVDMDWHYVDVYGKFVKDSGLTDEKTYGNASGWTGYTWNEELFPDYKAFLQELKARGLKITLNLHPSDGVRWFETQYKPFAELMGMDPDEKKHIPFDLTDEKFAKGYFELLDRPYEKDGVDFWWIDWQQGYSTKIKGLDPLWLLNHLHYKDSREHGAGLILSRYCGAGAQRYPLGFSGDTLVTWKALDYEPYFTATASNIGYTWWSHDIGGHMFGEKDNELAVRWVQFGVFSPINRLHSCPLLALAKEPWRYDSGTERILSDWLRLRHKLVPYIHTYNHLTHEQGKALIEPMYYEHAKEKWAYSSYNEYYFGDALIVCPITKKGKNGIGSVNVKLPKGRFVDLFTRQAYVANEGGKQVKMYRDLGSIPVLMRENSIIPLSEDTGNGCPNPKNLRVLIFGEQANFTMIEDDGENGRLETYFNVAKKDESIVLSMRANGENSVAPLSRNVVFEFVDIFDGEVLSVRENERDVSYSNNANRCFKVKCEYNGGDLVVIVKAKKTLYQEIQNALNYVKIHMASVIEKIEGNNLQKEGIYNKLMAAEDKETFLSILTESELPEIRKCLIKELFNVEI